jgi:hypothetical protein
VVRDQDERLAGALDLVVDVNPIALDRRHADLPVCWQRL